MKNKEPATVAKAFRKNWWSTFGAPIEIVHDQGREFSREFQAHLERCGATVRVTPADTPWHNSLVERHGQVLGEIVEASVEGSQIEGHDEMKLAAISAASAKNRTPDRAGYSARSRVFKTEERWPGAVIDHVLEGENPAELCRAVSDPWFKSEVQESVGQPHKWGWQHWTQMIVGREP